MPNFLKSQETLLALTILILLSAVTWRFPSFIAPTNLINVFNDTAPLILLALGQMVVILTRSIDLSVAANLALTGMIVALINKTMPDLPVGVLILMAASLGAFMGFCNGILVWKLDVPPIVVTLGTMTIFRGLIFLLTDGAWINAHEMTPAFKAFPRMIFLGIPVMSWIALFAVAGFIILMQRTPLGRAFYAVGGNPNTATYTGIDVGWVRALAFMICGSLAGITGYLWVARYAVAYVDIAGGFELEVVAACVIGGISIAGGIGTVAGAVLGSLFLGIVKNALPIINISPFWQLAISGVAILVAIAFNSKINRKAERKILTKARRAP